MSVVRHSFEDLPTSDSEIVLRERNKIIDAVSIKCLADHLEQVQISARLASNAASGSGDKDLYIQVRGLQTQMKDVYGNCAQAASQFTSASSSVINNLEIAFDMLLQEEEKVAINILSDSYSIAIEAQKKAEKLSQDIKKQADKVEEAIEQNKNNIKKAEKEKEEKKQELDRVFQSMVDFLKHEDTVENLTEEYKSADTEVKNKENKRAEKTDGFLSPLFPSSPTESDIEQAKNRRREKQEDLEKAKKAQRKLGLSFLEQLIKLDDNKDNWDEIIKGVTIECLENVAQGLAKVSATLGETATFWDQIAQRCEGLSKNGPKDLLDRLNSEDSKMTEEKRKQYYTKASFQNKAIKYYAEWVALHDVSFDFGRQIRIAQTGVFSALAEAPTRKQGIINATEIAKQLAAEAPTPKDGIINAKEIEKQLTEPQDSQNNPSNITEK